MDKYPISVRSWKNNWDELYTYFLYSNHLRKIIYTKNRSVFPIVTSLEKWTQPIITGDKY